VADLEQETKAFGQALDDITERAITHRTRFANALRLRADAHTRIVAQGRALVTGLNYDEQAFNAAIVAHNEAAQDIADAELQLADDVASAGTVIEQFALRVMKVSKSLTAGKSEGS